MRARQTVSVTLLHVALITHPQASRSPRAAKTRRARSRRGPRTACLLSSEVCLVGVTFE